MALKSSPELTPAEEYVLNSATALDSHPAKHPFRIPHDEAFEDKIGGKFTNAELREGARGLMRKGKVTIDTLSEALWVRLKAE